MCLIQLRPIRDQWALFFWPVHCTDFCDCTAQCPVLSCHYQLTPSKRAQGRGQSYEWTNVRKSETVKTAVVPEVLEIVHLFGLTLAECLWLQHCIVSDGNAAKSDSGLTEWSKAGTGALIEFYTNMRLHLLIRIRMMDWWVQKDLFST